MLIPVSQSQQVHDALQLYQGGATIRTLSVSQIQSFARAAELRLIASPLDWSDYQGAYAVLTAGHVGANPDESGHYTTVAHILRGVTAWSVNRIYRAECMPGSITNTLYMTDEQIERIADHYKIQPMEPL